ncbi:hypothetical protein CEV31_0726 [Brucella thiophenivorans]|uniref:Uncharacterized protein n=1 Tax=Brucella thiophenivorans TaxID=571255 RepID=A0A256G1X1_9HYPH|nr:hypothetical protein CEV31_0726 [Brucella thiophenivorans]
MPIIIHGCALPIINAAPYLYGCTHLDAKDYALEPLKTMADCLDKFQNKGKVATTTTDGSV